jgi:hypothetical protein
MRTDDRTQTLEAFADTILPGEKRSPDDHAIAGVSRGGGSVASGVVELLEHPAGGFADSLDGLMNLLNAHASAHAEEHGIALDETLPPFVALSYLDRVALVQALTHPDHPEKSIWVGLSMFSVMAFDSAAHLSTPEALEAGHPGLTTMGYLKPDPDGLWRFPRFSYGRPLANLHPTTTATGSPA